MLILSKHHDYYDCIARFGVDKTIVYQRNTQEIEPFPELKGLSMFHHSEFRANNPKLEVHFEYIVFCGTIYPMVKVTESQYMNSPKLTVYYDDSFLEKHDLSNGTFNFVYYRHKSFAENVNEFFGYAGTDKNDLNLVYKTPVIRLYRKPYSGTNRLELNPVLKDVKFFKVKNEFDAFQEIAQFISSSLCTEIQPKPSNVEDKYLITNHGFDKNSFRKLPTKRKG